jgi:branched-subunit amino acid transport protein
MASDAAVAISRPVILIFTIVSIAFLILIGTGFFILNKKESLPETAVRFLKWSGIGIIGLYMWFQIFQPAMAQLGLMNETNSLLVMGQGGIFDSNILQQFFLVAMPETIIFQVAFIGLGNRIYFYFNKTRLREKREKEIKKQMNELEIRLNAVDQVLTKDPDSRENIERMARYISLRQKYDKLREEIESGKVTKLPRSYFILPTVISAIIGSFIFSTYHSFRRGMSFLLWWQLPTFGLTYFGAGFLLCFIAFFSYPAAIFVHAFNNSLAILMAGGGI